MVHSVQGLKDKRITLISMMFKAKHVTFSPGHYFSLTLWNVTTWKCSIWSIVNIQVIPIITVGEYHYSGKTVETNMEKWGSSLDITDLQIKWLGTSTHLCPWHTNTFFSPLWELELSHHWKICGSDNTELVCNLCKTEGKQIWSSEWRKGWWTCNNSRSEGMHGNADSDIERR